MSLKVTARGERVDCADMLSETPIDKARCPNSVASREDLAW
jgi:hypothetical protein